MSTGVPAKITAGFVSIGSTSRNTAFQPRCRDICCVRAFVLSAASTRAMMVSAAHRHKETGRRNTLIQVVLGKVRHYSTRRSEEPQGRPDWFSRKDDMLLSRRRNLKQAKTLRSYYIYVTLRQAR